MMITTALNRVALIRHNSAYYMNLRDGGLLLSLSDSPVVRAAVTERHGIAVTKLVRHSFGSSVTRGAA